MLYICLIDKKCILSVVSLNVTEDSNKCQHWFKNGLIAVKYSVIYIVYANQCALLCGYNQLSL